MPDLFPSFSTNTIVDRLKTAGVGFGLSKLSGASRNAAELLTNLYGQYQAKIGAPTRSGNKGKRDPLAAAQARNDPLLGIDWYCDLPFLSGAASQPTSLGWEMVEEATLPMFDFEPQSNYQAGKLYHYPAHQNLGNLTLRLYEDTSGQSSAYIKNWQSLIYDKETGLYNPPSKFKLAITFTMFDVAKLDVMVITYLGCWPQNVDAIPLVGGASDRVIPSVTFSVDDIRMSFAKLSAQQAQSVLQNPNSEFPNMRGVFPSLYPT